MDAKIDHMERSPRSFHSIRIAALSQLRRPIVMPLISFDRDPLCNASRFLLTFLPSIFRIIGIPRKSRYRTSYMSSYRSVFAVITGKRNRVVVASLVSSIVTRLVHSIAQTDIVFSVWFEYVRNNVSATLPRVQVFLRYCRDASVVYDAVTSVRCSRERNNSFDFSNSTREIVVFFFKETAVCTRKGFSG